MVRHLRFSHIGLRCAALHGGEESHNLILVHDHCPDGVDDLKVFHLGFLAAQLLELLLKVLDLLLNLCS